SHIQADSDHGASPPAVFGTDDGFIVAARGPAGQRFPAGFGPIHHKVTKGTKGSIIFHRSSFICHFPFNGYCELLIFYWLFGVESVFADHGIWDLGPGD
ncbi:MAG: hypothetical protein KBB56_04350, partial [Acidobacteria bacterium]|nr:hypothetical protein [Acidobacteriota bacterium]